MCDSPFYVKLKTPKLINNEFKDEVPVKCGICPKCKMDYIRQWTFRIKQEEKISISSYFITLTYDNKNVHITNNGYMTLPSMKLPPGKEKGTKQNDFTLFMKKLRKYETKKQKKEELEKVSIKYYAVGEYGENTQRPHYHAIIMNVRDKENIAKAWNKGNLHIGTVTGGSIAYCLKYVEKKKIIPVHQNDDRIPEQRYLSKGLGKSYITKDIINYHKRSYENYHLQDSIYKIPIPKYYRDKIYNENEIEEFSNEIHNKLEEKYIEDEQSFNNKNFKGITFEYYKDTEKISRWEKDRKQKRRTNRNKI